MTTPEERHAALGAAAQSLGAHWEYGDRIFRVMDPDAPFTAEAVEAAAIGEGAHPEWAKDFGAAATGNLPVAEAPAPKAPRKRAKRTTPARRNT